MRTEGNPDATDPDLASAAVREAMEEVGCAVTVISAIGPPLYLPMRREGQVVQVDCAQAFLVATDDIPHITDEALAVAFVHQQSFAGFNVVSRKADPTSPIFGRTPVMIFDGLSVTQEPFWTGTLTDQIRESIIGDPGLYDYVLLDGGAYFGLLSPEFPDEIELYHRLNPDQPGGRFHGALDQLITS